MGSRGNSAQLSVAWPERDASWREEASLEIVRSVAEMERSTLLSNLAGTILLIAISQLLPNAEAFLLPAALRIAAIGVTALFYAEIRKRIEDRRNFAPIAALSSLGSMLGGTSWALLLAPVFIDPALHPASFVLAGGILVAVSLVASNSAALTRNWISFGIAFLGVFWLRMLEASPTFGLPISIGVGLLYAAVAAFGLGAARQRRLAAEMLVDNQRLGEELAEALAHAEFLAFRDPLTGLSNRRAFFERAAINRPEGQAQQVMILDIDLFKQVNDLFGHETGDRMLVSIGESLRDILRALKGQDHCAARLGGEEFAILLNTPNVAEANDVAESIRLSIASIAKDFSLPQGVGTVSIGVSTLAADEGMSDALRRADDALYEVKQSGRGKVRRHSS